MLIFPWHENCNFFYSLVRRKTNGRESNKSIFLSSSSIVAKKKKEKKSHKVNSNQFLKKAEIRSSCFVILFALSECHYLISYLFSCGKKKHWDKYVYGNIVWLFFSLKTSKIFRKKIKKPEKRNRSIASESRRSLRFIVFLLFVSDNLYNLMKRRT